MQIMTLQSKSRRVNILLYNNNPTIACRLTEPLTSQNLTVTTAHSHQDLQDAINFGGLDVATTNTAGVEITRWMTTLPVINFDASVFAPPRKADGKNLAKQLDSVAFIKRLFDVVRP
ncbi:hypothetical protein HFC70_21685 [Agrobacterium sp. a22-2]|uniref:hypothetical protein n=1 Tax=Agrobacterium sp. a22-2 TaxID=2283840 RepID=UPI0014450545|nr:hypothetical protein [Agrobacterium sp. a22-2]NKN38971.1 hypothetical protein [Agrobacterium sp. a22-2]